MESKKIVLVTILMISLMALVEVFLEPSYWIKSAIKIVLFLVIPIALFKPNKKLLNFPKNKRILLLGIGIYAIMILFFFMTRNYIDYKTIIATMTSDQKVPENSYLLTAFYISFINSFIEEYFFRYLTYLQLATPYAFMFSALAFACYHIAMIMAAFPPVLLVLTVLALTVAGMFLNGLDKKDGTLTNSYLVHCCADLAIMTVWFLNM